MTSEFPADDEKSAYDYLIKGKAVPPHVHEATLNRLRTSGLLDRHMDRKNDGEERTRVIDFPTTGPWYK